MNILCVTSVFLLYLSSTVLCQTQTFSEATKPKKKTSPDSHYHELFAPIIPPSSGGCDDPATVCSCGYKYMLMRL
ncbi:MAG: hypothetical protein NZ661_05110 [Candidatus Kapabacteria bacterium]|nr:hypothetical protein [Candidatus Kapabacteria bacterium]